MNLLDILCSPILNSNEVTRHPPQLSIQLQWAPYFGPWGHTHIIMPHVDNPISSKSQLFSHLFEAPEVLYHFNLRFTGCDMWHLWTLSGQVHRKKLVWPPQNKFILRVSWDQLAKIFGKPHLMQSSQLPVTHDEIIFRFNSLAPVTCDWTLWSK
jgi:hypothetical protein